ncbi:MAG: hypothetical protein R3C05_30690 [Pirellulaceae bacterium]
MKPLQFELQRADGSRDRWTITGTVNVGRQDPSCSEPPAGMFDGNPCGSRLIVASAIDRDVPRTLLRSPVDGNDQIGVRNLHQQCELPVHRDAPIAAQTSRCYGYPVELMIRPQTRLRVSLEQAKSDAEPDSDQIYRTLNSQPLDPMSISMQIGEDLGTHVVDPGYVQGQDIVHHLQQPLPVIRESVDKLRFVFSQAAALAAVRIAKLQSSDRAAFLRRSNRGPRRGI